MAATTIKIYDDTKHELDKFRESQSESYDDVLRKVIYIARSAASEPKLSRDAITAIERARARFKTGHYLTERDARKRLGM